MINVEQQINIEQWNGLNYPYRAYYNEDEKIIYVVDNNNIPLMKVYDDKVLRGINMYI